MRNKLRYAILGGCVAALLLISLSGCAKTPPPTPPANWYWNYEFGTGNHCNETSLELPMSGTVSLTLSGDNSPPLCWNVPKMWIYLNGKQVAYDVGRLTKTKWEGKVDKGDKVKFRACAETTGKCAYVSASVSYE